VVFDEDTPDALRDALRPDVVTPDPADRPASVSKLRG
jgi:bifunctional ADP-heptose synthase (sugar kinase/adenylyltransferase)